MKFNDYQYVRPNLDQIISDLHACTEALHHAKSVEEAQKVIARYTEITKEFSTQETLCSIRNSIDTEDKFYEQEQDFFDENSPKYTEAVNLFNQELVQTSFRKELEQILGKELFLQKELALTCFSSEIIEDLVEENKLATQYSKLIASAQIEFQGEKYTLAGLGKFQQSPEREVRKSAALASAGFFAEHEQEFDSIYDSLVKVRTRIAKKLGYDNFVPLGYARLGRSSYGSAEVQRYREEIREYCVPIHQQIIVDQKERIGLPDAKFYDLPFFFVDGNPTPKGDAAILVEKASEMYHEMSQETDEFFSYMRTHELMDLTTKRGKSSGGYCTYILNYQSPFIFSNFNGTSGDVDVLTHEAGHAFQVYTSAKNVSMPEYLWATLEASEVHSMSMEFFAYPWMEKFFQEDTKKYKYYHLSHALSFLPYGVAVDEFQHFVYEHPNATPEERKVAWRDIERKYLPHKDYDGVEILEKGGFWFRQGHIFLDPFYYIDYTLAQVCAFEFFLLSLENREDAWNRYVALCKLGGSKSFTELLHTVGISNPFEPGTVEKICKKIKVELEQMKL